MRRIRRICWLLGLLAGMCLLALPAFAQENQIYDLAGLLGGNQLQQLQKETNSLAETYNMNFVIVTTADARGKKARDYADDFYMDQGYTDNGRRGGVTFLIDMDNRQIWISTEGDMIYYLTDSRIQHVIDAGYAELKNGAYGACFKNMLKRVVIYIEAGVPDDQYTYDTEKGRIVKYRSIRPWEAAAAAGAALAAAAGAAVWVVGSYRMKWGKYKYSYETESRMKLYVKNDRFINQTVTTLHIPRNDPPPSGGGGGGGSGGSVSSTHTSSGGGTFGGGGRSF